MFSNDRNELRKIFFDCWKLKLDDKPLDAMQQRITDVIAQHPEYHALLQNETNLERDFDPTTGESNPFLHMSMHIALAEQLGIDRPVGVRNFYARLTQLTGSAHEAEHRIMECLSEALWQAQRHNRVPDENAYLDCIRKCLNT
jgi:Domain of unknown function (DUF1841)